MQTQQTSQANAIKVGSEEEKRNRGVKTPRQLCTWEMENCKSPFSDTQQIFNLTVIPNRDSPETSVSLMDSAPVVTHVKEQSAANSIFIQQSSIFFYSSTLRGHFAAATAVWNSPWHHAGYNDYNRTTAGFQGSNCSHLLFGQPQCVRSEINGFISKHIWG